MSNESSSSLGLLVTGAFTLLAASLAYVKPARPRARPPAHDDDDDDDGSSSDSVSSSDRGSSSGSDMDEPSSPSLSRSPSVSQSAEPPVPSASTNSADEEARRQREVDRLMDADRRLQEIAEARARIAREEEAFNRSLPPTSLDEQNAIAKREADIRDAQIINGEDREIQQRQVDQAERIAHRLDVVADAGDQLGENRPELTDKVVDETLKGLAEDAHELLDQLVEERDRLQAVQEAIPTMNEPQLEVVINRANETQADAPTGPNDDGQNKDSDKPPEFEDPFSGNTT